MCQSLCISPTQKSVLAKLLSTRKQLAIVRQRAVLADTDVQQDWASLVRRLEAQCQRLEAEAAANSLS